MSQVVIYSILTINGCYIWLPCMLIVAIGSFYRWLPCVVAKGGCQGWLPCPIYLPLNFLSRFCSLSSIFLSHSSSLTSTIVQPHLSQLPLYTTLLPIPTMGKGFIPLIFVLLFLRSKFFLSAFSNTYLVLIYYM